MRQLRADGTALIRAATAWEEHLKLPRLGGWAAAADRRRRGRAVRPESANAATPTPRRTR
jgi:hypothetical protein